MKRLSISQRIKKAKSKEAKKAVVSDWHLNWKDDQMGLIEDLEHAIRDDNYDLLCRVAGQLKTVSEKRFNGLLNVLNSLIEDSTNQI